MRRDECVGEHSNPSTESHVLSKLLSAKEGIFKVQFFEVLG
jgi:hypothetical protein